MGILKKKTRKISKLPELAETESARAEMKSFDDSSASSRRKLRELGDDDTLGVPTETASDDCTGDERVENSAEQKEFATKLEQANNGFARAMLYIAKAFLHGDCGCPGQDTTEAKKWCQKIIRSRVIKDEDLKDEAREILKQINSAGSIEIADSNDDAETEVCDQESSQPEVETIETVQDSSQPVDYGALSNEDLKSLADSGDAEAQNLLGVRYADGLNGLRKNKKRAFSLFLESAEKDNGWGMYNLAACLRYGNGCSQDFDQAVEWYKLANQKGIDDADSELSQMSLDAMSFGEECEQSLDFEQALIWYRRAARLGCHEKGLNRKIHDIREAVECRNANIQYAKEHPIEMEFRNELGNGVVDFAKSAWDSLFG